MTQTPPIRPRPLFARWLFERGLDNRQAGELFDASHETMRRVCLPFEDTLRRVPNAALMERIFTRTFGQVPPASFYPPEMSAAAATAEPSGSIFPLAACQ